MKERHVATKYIAGRPKACCERCGFIYRHDQLSKEWTGLMVCSPCWDPRPAEMTPPRVWPEGLPIDRPLPEPPYQFVPVPVPPAMTYDLAIDTDGNTLGINNIGDKLGFQ